MGTLSIDAELSTQIVKLQEDVEELTTEFNAAVVDIATLMSFVALFITVSQTSSAASTTGTYNTSNINMVTLDSDATTRAREVARSSLTKLRDI